jgi:hypothetical protein
MRNARHGSDATVTWMTNDVAQRGAADDLVSPVELVEVPGVVAPVTETPAFGLSFGMNPDQDPASAG